MTSTATEPSDEGHLFELGGDPDPLVVWVETSAEPRENFAPNRRLANTLFGQAAHLATSGKSVAAHADGGKSAITEIDHHAIVLQGTQLRRIDPQSSRTTAWRRLVLRALTSQTMIALPELAHPVPEMLWSRILDTRGRGLNTGNPLEIGPRPFLHKISCEARDSARNFTQKIDAVRFGF